MTKDPIAEAKREGWNEAIEAAAAKLEAWRDEYPLGEWLIRACNLRAKFATRHADAIRSLHKPTEESET